MKYPCAAEHGQIILNLKIRRMNCTKEDWEKALIGLTAGGSEFIDDPQYCVAYVKAIQNSQHEAIISFKRIMDKHIKQNEEMLELLKSLDARGGLGLDTHNRIRKVIDKNK